MFPSVLPLRAVVYQSLFLFVAIAIEAWVLFRLLRTSPRQSIQYATTINLLCVVVGWITFFLFNSFMTALPPSATTRFDFNLIDFIFFDRWSSTTATSLIFISFIMFFASFGIKQAGLSGLKWLLQPETGQSEASPDEVEEVEDSSSRRSVFRVRTGELERSTMHPQARAVLFANAWSFSAILAILILRFVFQSTLNALTS